MKRFPTVPIERRAGAFAIDFVAVWLICIPFGMNLFVQIVVFIVAWFSLRVVLVERNRGQSLGRWALDMRVIDPKFAKTPGFYELMIREGISGFGALLAIIGLNLGNPASLILLILPLAADCGLALADSSSGYGLAFHDRIAKTIIVASRRGFSLDLRLKKLVAIGSRRMK